MRRIFPLTLAVWLPLLAASTLSSVSLSGCSRTPTSPEPPIPEVPFRTMSAQVGQLPWNSVRATASPPLSGSQEATFVQGLGDSITVTILLPSRNPSVGTYALGEGWSGMGGCSVLTSQGWILYYTNRAFTGSATVTKVDSTGIQGGFQFKALEPGSGRVLRITAGAFNVPIEAVAAAR